MVLFVMHYVADADDPHQIVARLMAAMPSGSYLTMSDGTSEVDTERVTGSVRRFNAQPVAAQMHLRSRAQIIRYFDGLDFVEPGLVPLPQWRAQASPEQVMAAYAGMARKP